MTSGIVLSLCKTISVICNCFVLLLYFFSQAGYTLNAPASRRIIGYQFTNPHSGKGFTNVFAYEQHRNDAVRAGILCASLTMRDELTGVRRVDRPVPVLHARPLPGLVLDKTRLACTLDKHPSFEKHFQSSPPNQWRPSGRPIPLLGPLPPLPPRHPRPRHLPQDPG
jgi:hypothetical protein